MPGPTDLLRQLPQVDELVRATDRAARDRDLPRALLVKAARRVLAGVREGVLARSLAQVPSHEALIARILDRTSGWVNPRQCRVINATGVVLHTNLGRAVLSRAVLQDVLERLRGYSLLEVERDTGNRTKRDLLVSDLLAEITGAEAATVVNNNAAATHVILHTLASGREVICSHAHLVGIGGSFRMPDVMRHAGVTLRTVGATNHCLVSDYEGAINENSGMLIMVHTSNYQVVGFTKFATLAELVALGRKHGIPVVYDLGSGALVDVSRFGFKGHRVSDLVAEGPDLVCFSGDKLLGGPQAGIIVGRRRAVEAIRKSPFYRMMRPDKMTLALLESTLKLYLDPDRLERSLPVIRMISLTADALRPVAHVLAGLLGQANLPATIEVFDDVSEIGGGSLSNQSMPTVCVGVRPDRTSADALAARLRKGDPCVFARISEDRVVFDVRTLLDGEAEELVEALKRAFED